jgi:hypothetical protein
MVSCNFAIATVFRQIIPLFDPFDGQYLNDSRKATRFSLPERAPFLHRLCEVAVPHLNYDG